MDATIFICQFCNNKVKYSAKFQRDFHLKCLINYETILKQKELDDFKQFFLEKNIVVRD